MTWLEKSRNLGVEFPVVREQADQFLAMALWRLGRCEEARSALAEAGQLQLEWKRTVASHHGWPGFAWREWLIVEIVSLEAKMIAGLAALPDDVFATP